MSENADILELIQDAGVFVTTCRACADQLGVAESLEALDIEVDYMGVPLADLLKNDGALLTL